MEFDEVIETRRSVHQYTDEDIDDETLEAIFEQVRYAPSSFDLQPWEFLVVRDDDNLTRLQEVANGQETVGESAATVVVLGNTDPSAHADRVFDDWLNKGYIPSEDVRDNLLGVVENMSSMPDEERRLWTTRSTSLAAMALMHAAWNEGVASCPMEGFDADALVDEFDIEEGYEPVMLVTLGYAPEEAPDQEKPRKLRRPVDEIVHYETFDPEAESPTPSVDD
ncbi:nitroreductase family protein [Halogranum rubrum]|uniref:NAD(P)H nitroreductase n=1 Tax=Halogranum salarium B-1 TaxID=1210908 RepID=J3JEZ6_9EURY|nr:nitroreductase family protein [Halogranum salarium]EJN58814.1 NAD(P)H nitroreductase [Halogranum salarium B-1]